jgi:hypothetical protein
MGLCMDAHVPAAITRGRLLRGVDVLTAQLDAGKPEDFPNRVEYLPL